MKISFELTLGLTPTQKSVLRWGVVSGIAMGAVGLGVAFADLPTDLTWIASGKPVKATSLARNFADLQQQMIDPACPPGYTLDTSQTGIVDCRNGADDVVKVGTKASAFWIDRYETSFWSDAAGTQTQYGATESVHGTTTAPDWPSTFPANGQRGSGFAPLYAVSKAGVQPSAGFTWFQAVSACEASGKRLPNGEEWLRAANGTTDNTCNLTPGVAAAGSHTNCASAWGAQDMVGNLWEWTSEWFASLQTSDPSGVGAVRSNWPDDQAANLYHGDGLWNVTSWATNGSSTNGATTTFEGNVPVAALRGGDFNSGSFSGVFALYLGRSPTSLGPNMGVRCVLPNR